MDEIHLLATGVALPGAVGLPAFQELIRGGLPLELPAPQVGALPAGAVPPRLARRLTRLSGLALVSGREALDARQGSEQAPTPLVWATANGEINTIGSIMDSLLGPRHRVSPSQFHNSVYNAPTGYWGIVTGRQNPSTTVSRGELSFEYGLLESWSRIMAGTAEVQLTAGDEAIEVPGWADPAHSSYDLCGSLWLARPGEAEPQATLLGWHQGRPADLDALAEEEARLAAEHGADTVFADHRARDGRVAPDLTAGRRNPCSGLLALLCFLHDPGAQGTALLSRSDRDGDWVAFALRKEAG